MNLRQLEMTKSIQRAITTLAKTSVPVIAAIHGWCIGGGLDIVTACDIRLASADALFGIRAPAPRSCSAPRSAAACLYSDMSQHV